MNIYIFKKDLYFVQMRHIFFTFLFIFLSVKKVFFSKKVFQCKTFFPYKNIFSASNVDFVKNTNIISK